MFKEKKKEKRKGTRKINQLFFLIILQEEKKKKSLLLYTSSQIPGPQRYVPSSFGDNFLDYQNTLLQPFKLWLLPSPLHCSTIPHSFLLLHFPFFTSHSLHNPLPYSLVCSPDHCGPLAHRESECSRARLLSSFSKKQHQGKINHL